MNYSVPYKIIFSSGKIENANACLKRKSLQVGLRENDNVVFQGKSYLILDFGKELAGGIRILTYSIKGAKTVRLRFGESVGETCADIGWKGACNDHSNRDMIVELQSYSDMTFGQTGFRFLRIDVLSNDTILQIKSIVAAKEIDSREEIGSFECDDTLVNEIWNTAAYTLRLCMQNGYFWDGIKRDRLVWIGDLYPEMRAAHCLFGVVPETVNSLDFAEEQSQGLTWISNMSSYALWWMIIACDELKTSGDVSTFSKYIPRINDLLRSINQRINEDGSSCYEEQFIDWPTKYTLEEPIEKKWDSITGMEYLTQIAVNKVLYTFEKIGLDADICTKILGKLAKAKRAVNKYKQIAGLGVWAGDDSKNNETLLLKGGAKGMSTFMSYPILTAVSALGKEDIALKMMKDYYGGMLSMGATTFWEDFDIKWLENASRIDEMPCENKKDIHGDYGLYCYKGYRHSFCHGWSAGVIPYLIETVAGVKIEDFGMKGLRIEPKLSGLKHVKAKIPTPYGIVSIEHIALENGKIETKVEKPTEIKIIE